MTAAITRPLSSLTCAPGAPWLRFLEGDDPQGGTPGNTQGTGSGPAAAPAAPPADPPKPPAQEPTDWKAEARKWEQRAKENSKAAEKLQEIEDAKKSEIQRATDRAEKAEARATELEAAQTRRDLAEKVAATKRVPVHLLMRGGGDTEETMNSYADDIIAYRGGTAPGVVTSSGTGGDGGDKPATSSVAAGRERFEARHNKKTNS